MRSAPERKEMKAAIYGSLHGEYAVGITGIYHDNTDSPMYVGAIAGARSDMRQP